MPIRSIIDAEPHTERRRQIGTTAAEQALARAVEAFVALDRQDGRIRGGLYHQVVSRNEGVCVHILRCEEAGCGRGEIQEILAPARTIHARSPFLNRLQEWPRGYPGDFETVDYLCEARNRAPLGTIEHCLEAYCLKSGAAQQHRNKVRHQASLILDTFQSCSTPRVLSLACGGCRDVRRIQGYLTTQRGGQLVLNDLDASALDAARTALQPIGHLCQFVPGNVLKVARKIAATGPFDLVIAGGLFDYLPAPHARFLIEAVYGSLLRPGGRFFFTNLARGNPYRPWMEYLANWILIERSECEILELCRAAGVDQARVTLRREETGLTLLAQLTRAG
jgi:SAM-dependent methyltransferase